MNQVQQLSAILADINQRLTALEQGTKRIDETFTPNSYSVDAAGNVNVSGINIPAGTTATPPNQSRIRWLRQSDGALVAQLVAYEILNSDTWTAGAFATGAANTAVNTLGAQGGAGSIVQLVLNARRSGDPLTSDVISFSNGGSGFTLIDGTSRSDFALTNSKAATATGGAAALPANPQGFIVTKDTTGNTLKIPYYNV